MRSLIYIALGVALGVALLAKGLELYDARLARIGRGETGEQKAATQPAQPPQRRAPRPGEPRTPPPPPEPTQAELDALATSDPAAQQAAAQTLLQRQVTPALAHAVEAAWSRGPTKQATPLIACLKAKLPGRENLQFAIDRFPTDPKAFEWNLPEEARCTMHVLAGRAAEDPDRIRDLFQYAALSFNGSARDAALTAFRKIDRPLPGWLLEYLSRGDDYERRFAFQAALALGALTRMPGLVEQALDDERLASSARGHLAQNDTPAAAQMLARIAVRDLASSLSAASGTTPPQPPETYRVLLAREATLRDMSAPLVAIALDESKPSDERRAALEILGRHGDTGAAPHLERLAADSADAELTAHARAAIEELEGRRKRGHRPRMAPPLP